MENLVGIGVADAAEKMGIGERTLHSVIFARQRFFELLDTRTENFQAAGIVFCQCCFAAN